MDAKQHGVRLVEGESPNGGCLGLLKGYKVILASNSPRRKELLGGLGIPFEVRTLKDIDESYPDTLLGEDIPMFISGKKAEAYKQSMSDDELIITADTIVYDRGKVLGKPKDRVEAIQMLRELSGHAHEVITGVSIVTKEKTRHVSLLLPQKCILIRCRMRKSSTMWIITSLSTKRVLMAFRSGLVMWQSHA